MFAMLPNSPHEFLIEWYDPAYIDYVRHCLKNGLPVKLSLTGHCHNQEMVQACLWYAIERGLAVTVVSRGGSAAHSVALAVSDVARLPVPTATVDGARCGLNPGEGDVAGEIGFHSLP